MAGVLGVLGAVVVVTMFYLAAAGQPLHHDFATKAAAVDGEMVDVVSNMSLVKTFCAVGRELDRFGAQVDCEMAARSRKPALSRAASRRPRPGNGCLHDRAGGLGGQTLGKRRTGDRRRRRLRPAPWVSRSCTLRGILRSRWSTSRSMLRGCRRPLRPSWPSINCGTIRRPGRSLNGVRRSNLKMSRLTTPTDVWSSRTSIFASN